MCLVSVFAMHVRTMIICVFVLEEITVEFNSIVVACICRQKVVLCPFHVCVCLAA